MASLPPKALRVLNDFKVGLQERLDAEKSSAMVAPPLPAGVLAVCDKKPAAQVREVAFAEVPNFEPPSNVPIKLAQVRRMKRLLVGREVKPKKEKKSERGPVVRHARTTGRAFQAMCRRRDWASLIY